jgi:hypothetical protein
MDDQPKRQEESLGGYIVHGVPFPLSTDPDSLKFLQKLAPLQIEQEYKITYLHSYGQDSPWFAGLTHNTLLASQNPSTGYTYANPRGHDMATGTPNRWIDITNRNARIHAFTVCYFGSEEFLGETPYILGLIEFDGVDTLLLTRLLGLNPNEANLEWIGMTVKPRFLRNSKLKPTDVYFIPG